MGLLDRDQGPYTPPAETGMGGRKPERPKMPTVPPTMAVNTLHPNLRRLHQRVLSEVREDRARRPGNQNGDADQ